MFSTSKNIVRLAATDLTGTFVYCDPISIREADSHTLLATYDPDENAGHAHVIVEISHDDMNTAAASSEWVQIGTVANTSGTLAFTASEFKLDAAAAGTKVEGHWDIKDIRAMKLRVGAKETFDTGSNAGNLQLTLFSYINV